MAWADRLLNGAQTKSARAVRTAAFCWVRPFAHGDTRFVSCLAAGGELFLVLRPVGLPTTDGPGRRAPGGHSLGMPRSM